MSKFIARLMPLLLFALFGAGNVNAQPRGHGPQLNYGDAVVTGFSGTQPPDTGQRRAASKSAIAHTFIDPEGPSARIFALGHPGFVWDGRLFDAPKTFEVRAKDVGQVFGIALDDQQPPNIYLSATSLYGLNIVRRGRNGAPERLKEGGPGAVWMQGQFGLALQGGPGAIYKVDGRSGAVTLFANVTLDGVPNPGPALGNLAYDAAHKQLFVSDLYTGMIHRFDLDGRDLGHYDHGITGLAAAKIAEVPFDPKHRPDIASARFNSENPDSWDFAPAPRQVFGLAVHDGRLYYSVAAGPQIWSVGIAADGSFAGDARLELDVPAPAGALAVTDIAFTRQGAMILAQRAGVAGTFDYSAFTQAGEPRVLRFTLKTPNDPPSPGLWKPMPEEYAVGFAGEYRNTEGGVALGYGYDKNGTLDRDACEAALWTSGQNLRDNPRLRRELEAGGPLLVNGLQGSPAALVRPANTPPKLSYFIDYDGKFDDPRAAGHMGSVRILTKPCAGAPRPIAANTPMATPIATHHQRACTPTCVCPPGTVLEGKDCVSQKPCPDGQVIDPLTGACGCPPHTHLIDGHCLLETLSPPPQGCQPPMVQIIGGQCVCPSPMVPGELPGTCMCPDGSAPVNGHCEPPPQCEPPLVLDPTTGACKCPHGGVLENGHCVPQVCPPPLVPGPCVKGTPIDLGIAKTGETSPPPNVPWYGFHITVTNHGPASAPGGTITVTDVVPAGMNFTAISGTGWTCVPPSGGPGAQIVCTYGPATNAGDVLPTIDITAQAIGDGPFPPFTNCAVVAPASGSGLTDIDASDDQACVTVSKPEGFGRLSVTKQMSSDPLGIANTLVFHVSAVCTNPNAHYTMTVHNNTSSVPINVPVGSICTFTELLPALPEGCTWNMPAYSPTSVTISNGLTQDVVSNGYTCKNTPPICPPPQVLNEDNICACPPPMVPGAAPGTCACPDGMALVNGACVPSNACPPPQIMIPGVGCRCPHNEVLVKGECQQPIICRAPFIPNAEGTACVCKHGLVERGHRCVEPIVCRKPAYLNSRGTACLCPRGMEKKGNTCVERERRHNRTEDILRGIPGHFDHGNGSQQGGGSGGAVKH